MSRPPFWQRYARLHGDDPRRDVDEEFAFHLEERVEALVARGVSPEAARREALARFGDIHGARRTCVQIGERRSLRARTAAALQSLAHDTRYAARVFARSPVYAATVILTAALGIGANAVVFSVLDTLLFRALPVESPSEIVRAYTSDASVRNAETLFGASSYPDYLDFRKSRALSGLAAYTPLSIAIRNGATIAKAEGRLVSENFFAVLGVRPALGRLLSPIDTAAAEGTVVVLDYRYWLREFGGDSSILGRRIDVNGTPAFVVGVASREFTGLDPSTVDVYVSMSAHAAVMPTVDLATNRGARLIRLIGRRASKVTDAQIASELNAIMIGLGREYPTTNRDRIVTVRPARSLVDASATGAPVIPLTALLFGTTGLVLVIAAVNIASLVLARTLARRRELAVRTSLGASRSRVMRQLVTESALLAVIAELVVLFVVSLMPALARSVGVPSNITFATGSRLLAFASLVTVVATSVFALWPSWRGASGNILDSLRESTGSPSVSRARAQRVLVSVQVSLSVVLLVCAGMLIQSLRRQLRVDPGFEASRLVTAEFESTTGFQTEAQEHAFARAVLERVRALPGVIAAAVATNPPLTSEGARTTIEIPTYQPGRDESMDVPFASVGADYFAALGVPMLRGEELHGAGDTLSYVVINQSMARRYWPNRDPIGATIRVGGTRGRAMRVVGVAADARLVSLAESSVPRLVVQSRAGGGGALLVRTASSPDAVADLLRRMFAQPAGGFALRRVRTMEEVIATSLLASKALADTIACASAVALVLAIGGLYGLISYVGMQRTREFGIRMAIGAEPRDILRMVLSSGLKLAAIGVGVGLGLSVVVGLVLRRFLYSAGAVDRTALAIVVTLVSVAALMACLGPAVHASRTSPTEPLRAD